MDIQRIVDASSQTRKSWQPYPAYKDSGVDWLGEIPSHWQTIRLKFVADVNMGQSPNSDDYNLNGEGPPFLQGNAEFGLRHPTPRQYCLVASKHATEQDILLSVRAPVGALNIADQMYGIGRGLCAITLRREHLNQVYAWYALQVTRTELDVQATGSTYEAVSTDEVANMCCPIPLLSEQQAIAAFLDCETARLDTLVVKQERLIKLLQEKRAALISHAVTKGLDPSVPMKDLGIPWLGEIPEHWDITQFKYIAEISYGLTLQLDRTLTEGTPIISMPNVTKEGQLLLDDVPMAPALTEEGKKKLLLRKGDLLFNWRSGSPEHVGKTAYFDADGEYTHVSFLLRIRTNPERQESRYYQMYINSLRNMGFFGSSKDRVNKTYNQTELQRLEVVVPPLDEQRAVAVYLVRETAKLDALIAKVQALIDRLQEYRTALISAAVTGKIDVRGEQPVQGMSQVCSGGQE